jgi:hypothetical protein
MAECWPGGWPWVSGSSGEKHGLVFERSLSYNYLHLLSGSYSDNASREKVPFYALKMSLIYQFDFKKKKSN